MAVLELVDDQFLVTTTYNDRDRMVQIPGARWDGMIGRWRVPQTWAACLQLRGIFGHDLIIHESVSAWAWEQRQIMDEAMKLRDLLELPTDHVVAQAIDRVEARQ